MENNRLQVQKRITILVVVMLGFMLMVIGRKAVNLRKECVTKSDRIILYNLRAVQ